MQSTARLLIFLVWVALPAYGQPKLPLPIDTNSASWTWQETDSIKDQGWAELSIAGRSSIDLPTPIPNVSSATVGRSEWPTGKHVTIDFNADASQASLILPGDLRDDERLNVTLRFAEYSQQFPNGRIVFSALDAEIIGKVAKLESHPGNHRIGFWSEATDYVQWQYKATRPGKYTVQLTYALAGDDQGGSDVVLALAGTAIQASLTPTGSWYRYTTVDLGTVYLAKPTDYLLTVKCTEKRGNAVMNLKAVTLVPTCEGTMPEQGSDGTILLHAKDATANGLLLQWEPRDIKRTLGYWANPNDYAYWDFQVDKGGKYQVQISQGCGKGNGGSVADFSFYEFGNDETFASFQHTVKDTGHWQAFEPVALGSVELTPGKTRLRVTPVSKAKAAVMDLQQVLLIPVD